MIGRGIRSKAVAIPLALVLAATGLAVVSLAGVPPAHADVTTGSNDNARDGWYPDEAALSPSNVSGSSFGRLFSVPVVGQVYAQPIVVNGILLVTTEDDNVYGLDAVTGSLRWGPVSLGVPWNAADIGCGDLAPHVGVTGTPVVDTSTETAYMVSKTYATGSSGPAVYNAHALDMATGAERPGYPVPIAGVAANSAGTAFHPTTQLQRPALVLTNGVVYAAFGSHCDIGPYAGWIAGIPTWQTGQTAQATLTTLWTDAPGNNGAGIWGGGSGLMSDGPGQLVFAAGNGMLDPTLTAGPVPGSQVPSISTQTITRVQVQPDGSLKATDFFAPYDAPTINANDQDVGSGGPVALPPQFGVGTSTPNLLAQVGKEGYVYLLNRNNLGGYQQANGGDASVARVGPDGGAWTRPAAWGGDGGYIYLTTSTGGVGALSGYLRAFRYGLDGTGRPTLSLAATSPDSFGFGSGAPVITSSGTAPGSGVVWVEWNADGTGAGAQLRAYNAEPVNGAFQLLWSSPIGTGSKFAMPAFANGRAYVGTRDGNVMAFGSPAPMPVSASPLAFPTTVTGQTSSLTGTFTANQPVNITGFASDSKLFTLGASYSVNGGPQQPIVTDLSVPLNAGDTISVAATFAPTAPGLASGNLNVTTSAGPVSASMTGQGQSPTGLLVASPSMLSLGAVSVAGPPVSGSVVFANEGATSITVAGETSPSAPLSQSGLPPVGATLAPGASVTVTVTDTPTTTGAVSGSVTLDTTGGNITVPVTATVATPPTMVITPLSYDFGNVPLGLGGTSSFTIANTGGSPLTVSKSKPPALGVGFNATSSLPEGTTIPPGGVATETVTFAATVQGSFRDQWILNGNDGAGLQTVSFTATAVPAATLPDPTNGGWQLNGSATIVPAVTAPSSPAQVELTSASPGQAGTAFWPVSTPSRYLSASFDATIIGGTGADGLTLLLADPAAGATAHQVGASGGGLGFAGIPGIAVGLVTYQNGAGANSIGITNGPTSPGAPTLNWITSTNNIPPLRAGVDHVVVTTANGILTVSVNGAKALSGPVTLPPNVLIGFTGGTGGLDDIHEVANVAITIQAPPVPTLNISTTVAAPAGSAQLSQTSSYSGTCPSAFAVPAQGNGSEVSPTLTGALAFDQCGVVQSSPGGTGWATAVSINGGPAQVLTPNADGSVTVPAFELGYGPNTVVFTNTYHQTGIPPAVPPPGAPAWQFNGSAKMVGTALQLTAATANLAGSAFYGTAVKSSGLHASFDASLSSGTGGDGITLTLADPSRGATPTSIGRRADGLGFAGIPGVAAALVTHGNGFVKSKNFVGITPGPSATKPYYLTWLTTTTQVPPLRNSTVHVTVAAAGGTLTLAVNGTTVLTQPVSLPPQVLIGFTGSTGANYDAQSVSNVVIDGPTLMSPPSAGGWRANGTATITGGQVQLTPATAGAAGSSFSPTSISASSLQIAFDSTINSGTGADGLTLTLASATAGATPSSLGGSGWGLGFAGIPGLAVALETYQPKGPGSLVGITDGVNVAANGLDWLVSSTAVPDLRAAVRHVLVTFAGGVLTVDVDGTQVVSQTVTLPPSLLIGFTGSTGGLTDIHAVSNISITYE